MGVLAVAASGSQAVAAEDLRRYTVHGQPISVAVPATWRALDSHQARSDEKAVKRFVQGDPDFLSIALALNRKGSPLKFVAIDPKVRFRTRQGQAYRAAMNVIVTPASQGLSFERFRRNNVDEVRNQIGSDLISIVDDVVKIGGKQALRVRVTRKQQVGNQTLTIVDDQFAFLRPGRSIHFTYETVKQLASLYDSAFRESAMSIRIG